jgi:hypothetical protein
MRPGDAVVSPLRVLAAALEALAGWLDDGAAGGLPTKFLVAQAVIALREIAATARAEAELVHLLRAADKGEPGDRS